MVVGNVLATPTDVWFHCVRGSSDPSLWELSSHWLPHNSNPGYTRKRTLLTRKKIKKSRPSRLYLFHSWFLFYNVMSFQWRNGKFCPLSLHYWFNSHFLLSRWRVRYVLSLNVLFWLCILCNSTLNKEPLHDNLFLWVNLTSLFTVTLRFIVLHVLKMGGPKRHGEDKSKSSTNKDISYYLTPTQTEGERHR